MKKALIILLWCGLILPTIPFTGNSIAGDDFIPAGAQGSPADEEVCAEVLSLLKGHQQILSKDMRQIKREIAALGHSMEKPGIQEIFAGIGYILGLLGVAAFVASRKK